MEYDTSAAAKNLPMKNYLESIKKQFEYYKMLGDKTLIQVPDDKLF